MKLTTSIMTGVALASLIDVTTCSKNPNIRHARNHHNHHEYGTSEAILDKIDNLTNNINNNDNNDKTTTTTTKHILKKNNNKPTTKETTDPTGTCVNEWMQCGGSDFTAMQGSSGACCEGTFCLQQDERWHYCAADGTIPPPWTISGGGNGGDVRPSNGNGDSGSDNQQQPQQPVQQQPVQQQQSDDDDDEAWLESMHETTVDLHENPDTGYNYAQAMHLSLLFYETQRSGEQPADNRVPWRGDTCVDDVGAKGEDLSGGWFDAGDHIKFALPMAWSTTTLAWSMIEYKEAWEKSDEMKHMEKGIKWPLDWLMKAHTGKNEMYVQVGDDENDHSYWGRPENMPSRVERKAYKVTKLNPGSEPVAEAAAALAAGSIAFKMKDAEYSKECLKHAEELFEFADTYRGSYIKDGKVPADCCYPSYNGYLDELAWAGAWLYYATEDEKYKEKVEEIYPEIKYKATAFSWEDKGAGIQLLMYKLTGDREYKEDFRKYMNLWTSKETTPKGLTFYQQWGPLRYTSNTAFLALLGADLGINTETNRVWGTMQINYILGDCCGGINPKTKQPKFSYLIGFGDDYPKSPHHRGSTCEPNKPCSFEVTCSEKPNAHVLYGALVGGPGARDDYTDSCKDYVHNEVATDYNAGFTAAIAAIQHQVFTSGELEAQAVKPIYETQRASVDNEIEGNKKESN